MPYYYKQIMLDVPKHIMLYQIKRLLQIVLNADSTAETT